MEAFEPFLPKTGLTDKTLAQRTEVSGYAEETMITNDTMDIRTTNEATKEVGS
jgi:hypothetical protein